MVLRQLRNNFKTSFWDFFSLNPKSETWTLRFGCLCYRFDSAKTERQNKETKIPTLRFTRSVFGFLLPIQRFGAVESLYDSIYVYFLITNFLVVMVCPSDTIE